MTADNRYGARMMAEPNDIPQRRRWRRLALVVAGILASGALAACTDNSPGSSNGAEPLGADQLAGPGQAVSDAEISQLKVGIPGEVPTLNLLDNPQSGFYAISLGLESLLRIDSEGRLTPWLASEWRQVSDTVYEYTLREGVKFWDGTELTSEDVKYSWDLLRAPTSRRADYYASVERVDAPDKYTVRVTLKQPDASWQYTPAMFYSVIFQKDFFEQHEETFGEPGTLVMGTGPWRFDSLNPTSGMELSAHPDYWGGEPPIERISVQLFRDDNSMALALRAGEIDLAPVVNGPEGFDAAAGGGTTTTAPICATALLSMPTQTEPWDDVHVRRAVAYALNREEIIAATQGRATEPLDTLISPILLQSLATEDEVEAALDTVPTYPHDLDKAEEEMALSTVPDGFSFTMKIPNANAAVAQVIAAQLEEIGIELEIETMGDTAWYGEIGGPPDDRPLTWTESGTCTPDPSWDSIFLGSDGLEAGLNIANYAPAEIDRLLTDGLTTQDPKQRLEIYTAILQRLAEDVPYVPLYAEGTTYASSTYDIVDYGSYWVNSPWALNVKPR
jgi:peptide/nickel transport system substrate-binding protein